MHFTHIQTLPVNRAICADAADHFYAGLPSLVGSDESRVYFDLAGGTFQCDVDAWIYREANGSILAMQVIPPVEQNIALYVAQGDRLLVGPEESPHLAGGAGNLLRYLQDAREALGKDEMGVALKAIPYDAACSLPSGELNKLVGFIPW